MTGFPDADYPGRIEGARARMRAAGVDALLVSIGADLPYLIGYEAMPLERLTMLVVTDDAAVLIVPELEAPRVERRPGVGLDAWPDAADPIERVAAIVGDRERCAIGDPTWARFLLELQAALPHVRFESAAPLMSGLRVRKDAAEVALLRAAGAAADRVSARLGGTRFSGRTERDIAASIHAMLVEEGHDTAQFAIVASGPNAASPHHEPTGRVIERGDVVVVDFGGRLSGYCSDTTRTFSVGDPAPEVAEAYAVLHSAQEAGRAAVAVGVPAAGVDAAARSVIEEAGYGDRFIHRTGHGIGLEVHEDPYLVDGNEMPLEPGMAFSIEPGIYTAGSWGMRIEDIVVCSDAGADELNRADRSLIVVD
jgi:Xaa-Pro aminopeptidase